MNAARGVSTRNIHFKKRIYIDAEYSAVDADFRLDVASSCRIASVASMTALVSSFFLDTASRNDATCGESTKDVSGFTSFEEGMDVSFGARIE